MESTTNYRQFKMLDANREISPGHVKRLKKSLETNGNLTQVNPIIVNENMEIIDGQHRFEACKEMGLPVFYRKIDGLTVQDARTMNVLQRNWTLDDYAESYGATDSNYRQFKELLDAYSFSSSVVMAAVNNGRRATGAFLRFRKGEFVMEDFELAKKNLEDLSELEEFTPLASQRNFAIAFFRARQVDGFDSEAFLSKLRQFGASMRAYDNITDTMRSVEELYNRNVREENRLRLF